MSSSGQEHGLRPRRASISPERDELQRAEGLSEVDRALIRILQQDGRRSFARISRDLGIAEKTVRRRIRELISNGIIDITTITDPELLGYHSLALLGLSVDRRVRLEGVAAELARIDAVDYVVIATGRYDIFVELVCRDPDALLRTIEEEIASIAGVLAVETCPYLRLHYQHPYFGAGRSSTELPPGLENTPRVDDLDKQIILELNRDGRIPFQEIARDVPVSEALVRQRYKRLVDTGVLRVMALTNPLGLGFRTMAWVAITVDPDAEILEVADALSALPAVVYLAICAGRFDIFAEVISTDNRDLLDLLAREISRTPGVSKTETWLYLDLHYKRLRPSLTVGGAETHGLSRGSPIV